MKPRICREGPHEPLFIALETATRVCGLALLRGREPLFSLSFIPDGGHSSHLMPAVEAMSELSGHSPAAWRAVVVSRGPGSFTGLRIGMATAKALALGLGIPLYGVSTLEALAHRLEGDPASLICPVLDARKGQVFSALYRQSRGGLRQVKKPVSLFPEDLPRLAPPESLFTGDGLELYGQRLEEAFGAPLRFAPPQLRRPDAASVGILGWPKVSREAPSETASLTPEYIRASDAELRHGPRPARRGR